MYRYDGLDLILRQGTACRFGKEGLQFITDQLEERLRRPTSKGCAMDPAEQVCIALRYYATGVGDTMGRDKATVCRVVKHVTEGLVEMKDRFIRWPTRMDTRRNIMAGFAEVAGIPNVIGAIDGSHVEITKPGPTEERPFINRKGSASINVMAVCDNKEWPGSAHDSFVFRASSLQDFLKEIIHTLQMVFYLVTADMLVRVTC
ncbi:putative nuclease HARBI1 isoform X2 [Mya arenaria]|uniref:putative nuclease HARBI1 isoform X2 n=1 Tax=Mya arenaria TaxID=6604 RepID=UPI0022E129B0|nr:putative nuclease HARBI1 isoform X2 [Mya arenaria]